LPQPNSCSTRRLALAACFAAAAGLALATAAASPSTADDKPAKPYDRCAYMNHDSKAYQACLLEQAAAKQRAEAAPSPIAKPKPTRPPGS
jgi:hypothetical protein